MQDLQQIRKSLNSNDFLEFKKAINELNNINKTQLNLYGEKRKDQILSILNDIQRGSQLHKMQIKDSNWYTSRILNFAKQIQKSQLNDKQLIDRYINLALKIQKNEQVKVINQIMQTQQNKIIEQKAKQNLIKEKLPIQLKIKKQIIQQEQQELPIQKQIKKYADFLPNNFPIVTKSDVPKSVTFLAQYVNATDSSLINFTPQTNKPGVAYIGMKQVDQGLGKAIIPSIQQKLINTRLPNIKTQLIYHANSTIKSWNSFVEQEAKLNQFVGKINTKDKRKQYVSKSFQFLNQQTFSAQVLATLMYYYVMLPLQKYFKLIKYSQQKSSQQDFYTKYPTAGSLTDNPLILSKQQGVVIAKLLLNDDIQTLGFMMPTKLLGQIFSKLNTFQSKLNKTQITTIFRYPTIRTCQAQAFLQSNGIGWQQKSKLLQMKTWKQGIKVIRSTFPNQKVNTQMSKIITNVFQNSKMKNQLQYWDYTWNSRQIASKDYIFYR